MERTVKKDQSVSHVDKYDFQHLKLNVSCVTNRLLYRYLTCQKSTRPTAEDKWIEYYPFLETIDWSTIYTLQFMTLSDSRLQSFQYSILHRYFGCNYNLYLWKISENSLCENCNRIDTIEHYFLNANMSDLSGKTYNL